MFAVGKSNFQKSGFGRSCVLGFLFLFLERVYFFFFLGNDNKLQGMAFLFSDIEQGSIIESENIGLSFMEE